MFISVRLLDLPKLNYLTYLAANFEESVWQTTELTANTDLEHLGFVILKCMNGRPCKEFRKPGFVRSKRASNKIFGLQNGEEWSGCKLLVDFLDELFDSKPAIAKFNRPVSQILS